MKKFVLILILAAWLPGLSFGQKLAVTVDSTEERTKEYANPSVEGTPRGSFLIARYERQFGYDFNSRGHHLAVGERAAKIDYSNIAEIKGYVPLWNRPHLKMVLGVGYEREEFNFEDGTGYSTDFAYHKNLQDKGLKSLSSQLAILRPINDRNFWVVRVEGQLNGDYTSDDTDLQDYLRTTAEAVYGWKLNKNFAWGIALQFGYTYGRERVVPAILYNRTFNEHWGVESVFPANVTFRYRQSDASYFYAGYKLDGYSYVINVEKPPFTPATPGSNEFTGKHLIELRHNDAKLRLRWEREIYDFVWFSLEGGYRINVAYDAFEEGTNRKTKYIKTDVGSAPFAQAEVYLVVPKRFLKR